MKNQTDFFALEQRMSGVEVAKIRSLIADNGTEVGYRVWFQYARALFLAAEFEESYRAICRSISMYQTMVSGGGFESNDSESHPPAKSDAKLSAPLSPSLKRGATVTMSSPSSFPLLTVNQQRNTSNSIFINRQKSLHQLHLHLQQNVLSDSDSSASSPSHLHPELIQVLSDSNMNGVPAHCLQDLELAQLLLLAATLCLDYLNKSREAVEYSRHAVQHSLEFVSLCYEATEESSTDASSIADKPLSASVITALSFEALAYHVFGLACSNYAFKVDSFAQRQQLQSAALSALEHVSAATPDHARRILHLALAHADVRKISVATKLCQLALSLDTRLADGWHLFALLMSSTRQHAEALEACLEGLHVDPEHVGLLLTQARLLCSESHFAESFATLHRLVVKQFPSAQYQSQPIPSAFLHSQRQQKSSILPIELDSISSIFIASASPSTPSISNSSVNSILKSQLRRPVFSFTSSSSSSINISSASSDSLSNRVHVLVELANAYVQALNFQSSVLSDADKQMLIDDAHSCLKFALQIVPLESKLRALVHCALAEFVLIRFESESLACLPSPSSSRNHSDALESVRVQSEAEAMSHLEAALALDSSYVEAHVRLGSLHASRQRLDVAHSHLTAALRVDAARSDAWLLLGRVIRAEVADEDAAHRSHHASPMSASGHSAIKQGVLAQRNKDIESREAMLTAIELERTAPVRCFSVIPRQLRL